MATLAFNRSHQSAEAQKHTKELSQFLTPEKWNS